MNALKDAPMALLLTTSPNNALPNAPLYPTTHSQKTHPTSACNNVRLTVMEAHRICIVSQAVGGQTTPTIPLGSVFKRVRLDILHKTKLLVAT